MAKRTNALGPAPDYDAPISEFATYIADGLGLPAGYQVVRVVRHGGRDGTGLSIFIEPPGAAKLLRIRFAHESDCWNHTKFRGRVAADTRGLARAWRVNGPTAAMAMFEALCSMAETFEAADLETQTWEWVQELERVAARTSGSIASYQSLRRLQEHDYSKRLVQDPPRDLQGNTHRPAPLLLADENDGYLYVTARHMAVFVRYELGAGDAGSDDQLLTRLEQIGGSRHSCRQWNSSGRDRERQVRLVLYRLPNAKLDEMPANERV